jgi:hypothetical protein
MNNEVMQNTEMEDIEYIDHLTKEERIENMEPIAKHATHIAYYTTDFDISSIKLRIDEKEITIPSFLNDEDYSIDDVDESEENEETQDIEVKKFQRGYVWTNMQKDILIDSIISGYPMPTVFFIARSNGTFVILDGQQRLTTIHKFMNNKFKLGRYFKDENNAESNKYYKKNYDELPPSIKRKFRNYRIPATIIQPLLNSSSSDIDNEYQNSVVEAEAIYSIFERLNSGGTQLTPHEIRMAAYTGGLMECFAQLNDEPNWRKLYGSKHKNKRSRDHELITRIFAMYLYKDNYNGSPKEYLNKFCGRYKDKTADDLKQEICLFKNAILLVSKTNLEKAALRTREDGKSTVNVAWSESYISAIMDIMNNCGDKYSEKDYIDAIHGTWSSLLHSSDANGQNGKLILPYITSNTASPQSYISRFNIIKDKILEELNNN